MLPENVTPSLVIATALLPSIATAYSISLVKERRGFCVLLLPVFNNKIQLLIERINWKHTAFGTISRIATQKDKLVLALSSKR